MCCQLCHTRSDSSGRPLSSQKGGEDVGRQGSPFALRPKIFQFIIIVLNQPQPYQLQNVSLLVNKNTKDF